MVADFVAIQKRVSELDATVILATLGAAVGIKRLKVCDLYCKSRVTDALENTKDSTFKDIYNTYRYS